MSKGLDTDTRVKSNQWKYRADADLYNKYKNVYNNPKYYNQETRAINWPANDGFVSGSQKIETLGVGTKLDRYG
ncbi:hypothetical protein ACTQ4P_20340 [Clostridium sporogenes]|uniref:hypothetical protein n=1 Tax=Clostridium sporogenes TaxID=1509 RepID=UPI003F8E1DC8